MNRREFIERSILLNGCAFLGVPFISSFTGRPVLPVKMWYMPVQDDNPALVRLYNKCKGCTECLTTCAEEQMVYGTYEASADHHVCIHCGTCIKTCRYQALTEKHDWQRVLEAIDDPSKTVIASTSPAVRVGIGDYFGMEEGSFLVDNLVGSCRAIGFDFVLDTNFSADLTIMEESHELRNRLSGEAMMPHFTSCCPAWVKYVEMYYPHLLGHLSAVRSPIGMQGAMVKTYFAGRNGLSPEQIVHVAITPCTAKKYEITREELTTDGLRSTDLVITTNELAMMLKERNIDLADQQGSFDSFMGEASGGGIIFANTGGVTSAAIRTAYFDMTGNNPPADLLDLKEIQGLAGLKEAQVRIGKTTLRVAVCYEMKNARTLLDQVANGTCPYDFVEVMACKGGCVGGAGQPASDEVVEKRIRALQTADARAGIRFSHENPEIKDIYKKFLGKVGHKKAERYLHTSYGDKSGLLLASVKDNAPSEIHSVH